MSNLLNKIFLFLVSGFIGFALFLWIGKIVGWREIKNILFLFTGWQGAIILILTLFMAILANWKWQAILKSQGVKISFRRLFSAYLAGFSAMFLAPILFFGGETIRAYILNKRNAVSWPKAASSVFVERILEWTANLAAIFLGLLFFFLVIGLPPKSFAFAFGILLLFFSLPIVYCYWLAFQRKSFFSFFLKIFRFGKIKNNIQKFVKVEKEIFEILRFKNAAMKKALFFTFLRMGVAYLRNWILILFLGAKVSPLLALSFLGFNYLAIMIPIPATLGVHEAVQVFAFNSVGLKTPLATVFTMIIRGAELFIALLGIIVLLKLGISWTKKALFNNNNSTIGP